MTHAPVTPAGPPIAIAPSRPLIVTDDPDLLDDLVHVAHAARVEPMTISDPARAGSWWTDAPVVVVGADRVEACLARGLPSRTRLTVVGSDSRDVALWRDAARLGAEHVVILPDGHCWLIDFFALARSARAALIVGVLGAHENAGASTLAVALALAGARAGLTTMLVDADPFGGGIEVPLVHQARGRAPAGGGTEPAGTWPAGSTGQVPASSWRGAPERGGPRRFTELADVDRPGGEDDAIGLPRDALTPRRPELVAVGWDNADAAPIPPRTMAALLSSARRSTDLVVVDLPRQPDPAARAALELVSTVMCVVRASHRAIAAADRVCAWARQGCEDVRVVARTGGSDRLSPQLIADVLEAPLAGQLDDGVSTIPAGPDADWSDSPLGLLSESLLADLLLAQGREA